MDQKEMSQQAREAAEQVRAGAAEMGERGREAAGKMGAAFQTARARMQEQTTAGAKVTDRTIREHPYESLGVAFGIGLLIGVMIGRR